MKVIIYLLKSSFRQVLISSIASVAAALLYIMAIRSFNQVIKFTSEGDLGDFYTMCAVVIGSTILSIFAGHYITQHFEFKIAKLREVLSEGILRSNFEKVERNKARIVPNLLHDILTLGNFSKNLPDFLVSVFTVLAIWVYMFFVSWQFALIFIIIFGITLVIMFASQPYLYREEKKAIAARNILHENLEGLVSGLKELTLNSQHKTTYASTQVGPSSFKFAKHNVNRNKVIISVGKISESFILISLGLIIVAASVFFDASEDSFLEFFTLITFSLPSLIRIGLFFSNLKKAEIALDQIDSLDQLFKTSENMNRKSAVILEQIGESSFDKAYIQLKDLCYTYSLNLLKPFKVGPFNLEVNKGEILLINGGNGSGKTTLIKLLTGLYNPSEGEIKFEGQAISNENLEIYRDLFAAVFADSFVFQDLGYIKHDRVNPLLERYLDLLEIRDKVEVGEGIKLANTMLSFGQMSRLNLLRALLEDKPVYIFDEWAANQDPYFKAKFYREIVPSLKQDGKTVIIISHDDQYFDVADRRITVANGQLKTHQVLE